VIRERQTVSLPVTIGSLLLAICVAPGCGTRWCGTGEKTAKADNMPETGSAGVTVTGPVPHAGTTGAAPDNAGIAPSAPVVPRAIPIGKKPPPSLIPSTEEPR
jgi:hypothetical protein